MTREEQEYYEHYFDMFSSEGWKQFISEIEDIVSIHAIEDIKDEKHLNYIKGERSALYRVLRFAEGITTAYELNQEEADVA